MFGISRADFHKLIAVAQTNGRLTMGTARISLRLEAVKVGENDQFKAPGVWMKCCGKWTLGYM